MSDQTRDKIFVSYNHKDKKLFEELQSIARPNATPLR
jgi:hypothetical protein